jgi:predicted Zn-dependent protease
LLKHASLRLLVALVAGDPGPAATALELTRHLGELSYSRNAEIEADDGALGQLRRARIDPAGAAAFIERLGRQEGRFPAFLSTHPGSQARAARLRERLAAEPAVQVEPLLGEGEWAIVLRRLAGRSGSGPR